MNLFNEIQGEITQTIDFIDVKLKCINFAIQIHDGKLYDPDEIKDYAAKLFEWVTAYIDIKPPQL